MWRNETISRATTWDFLLGPSCGHDLSCYVDNVIGYSRTLTYRKQIRDSNFHYGFTNNFSMISVSTQRQIERETNKDEIHFVVFMNLLVPVVVPLQKEHCLKWLPDCKIFENP